MKQLQLVVGCLGVLLLSACATPPGGGSGGGTSISPIVGVTWRLDRIVGLESPMPDPSASPTLRFEGDARVSGFAGVNRCSGSVAIGSVGAMGETPLRFGPIATTRMAGPPERMALESAFLGMLGEVRAARTTTGPDGVGLLVLLGDAGPLATLVAEVVPPEDAPIP